MRAMPASISTMPPTFCRVIGSEYRIVAPIADTNSIATSTIGIEIDASIGLLASVWKAIRPQPIVMPAITNLASAAIDAHKWQDLDKRDALLIELHDLKIVSHSNLD